jgi:hypothetical protein
MVLMVKLMASDGEKRCTCNAGFADHRRTCALAQQE